MAAGKFFLREQCASRILVGDSPVYHVSFVPLSHPNRCRIAAIILGFAPLMDHAAAMTAGSATRNFDLATGDAAQTLKLFAAQAGCEIMFPADAVAGLKTNAVKGAFAP